MLRLFKAAVVVALGSTAAAGQSCVIAANNSPELRQPGLYIAMIADTDPRRPVNEKINYLRRALGVLNEGTAGIQNQIGRQYLLGRIYAVWLVLDLPGTNSIVSRRELELAGDPDGRHDLYASMDSAFAKVEALNPACADSTKRYRAAISWMAVNQARVQLQTQNLDSAAVLARRALLADPRNAAPQDLLAEVKRRRGGT